MPRLVLKTKNAVSVISELNLWWAEVQEITGVWPKLIPNTEKEDHGELVYREICERRT
jgi:hypothetical protein